MTHWSASVVPGSLAITSYSGLSDHSDLTTRCTRAWPGPNRYVIGRPPRQPSGTTAPPRADSNGWASAYEIGNTGILVSVFASASDKRFASFVAPTPGVSGSPGYVGMST